MGRGKVNLRRALLVPSSAGYGSPEKNDHSHCLVLGWGYMQPVDYFASSVQAFGYHCPEE